ncbi:hypothetical protein D6D03_06654 [Aureobasidium pullulans]|nr:hypothetical protein D6D03_06654 [Aureobasidium pullulans]
MAGVISICQITDEQKKALSGKSIDVHRDIEGWLEARQSLQARLAVWQSGLGSSQTTLSTYDVEDWSSTQSCTGIMTPTESWNDAGSVTSDATETGHKHPAITTKHNAEVCKNLALRFAQSMDEILDLPKAADLEVIAVYSGFVQDKCEQLALDLKQSSRTSAPAVPKSSQFWHSSMHKDSDTVGTKQTSNENKDEALEAIISGFGPDTVKEDIAKLVFLWVDVQEFAGFKRDDVMKMW